MAKYSKYNIIYLIQKWMDSVAGQTFMNYAYSWGAAIVILGTLFKLTHLPGANLMLFIGMGTEVFVFFIAAFDRPFDKTADGRELATDSQLAAPQANAMKAVIEPMMNGGSAPWLLYGIGALIALVLTFFKVPALPFALGMFIPIDLNMPMLIGGAISWYVSTRSKDKELNEARNEKGTLIASGFIAGGALMGVVSAILRFAEVDMYMEPSPWTEPIAIIPYAAIIIYMAWAALKAKK